jgi:hypothetical protein
MRVFIRWHVAFALKGTSWRINLFSKTGGDRRLSRGVPPAQMFSARSDRNT